MVIALKFVSTTSDNIKMDVKEMENVKEVNLWLKKANDGT